MKKEITISIEEYKVLIRCKTIVEMNKPTGIIYQTDNEVKFTSFDKTKVDLNKYLIEMTKDSNYPIPSNYSYSHRCTKCHSSSHRKWLFGERLCDNKKCENSYPRFL